MTIVSSNEFATNQDRYYDLAVNDDVFIERDNDMFHLMCATADEAGAYGYIKEYKKPDDDFRRAITKDELLKGIYEDIDIFFANK